MTFQEAWDYIEDLGKFSVKNSNVHTRKCLELLGEPDRRFRVVHVAGTNGKGSVCAYLASAFRAGGIRAGLFTSPHLVSIRERIEVDGRAISEDDFVRVFETVRACAKKVMEGGEPHPSYFEFLFLMACVYFAEMGIELAVIETGLGGRLDATNSLEGPELAVLTSIGLDHMKYLGNAVPEIAAEKAGIIKAGTPVVYDASRAEAAEVIAARAAELGCAAAALYPGDWKETGRRDGSIDFSTSFRYDGRAAWSIATPAPYQAGNAALSLLALKVLKGRDPAFYGRVTAERAAEGLLSMRWPARMQEIAPRIFLDGAHNEDGIDRFLEAARAVCGTAEAAAEASLIFSAASDKDCGGMVRRLAAGMPWKRICVTEIAGNRRTGAEALKSLFAAAGRGDAAEAADFREAYKNAADAQGDGYVFICGSLYLAGMAEEIIHD